MAQSVTPLIFSGTPILSPRPAYPPPCPVIARFSPPLSQLLPCRMPRRVGSIGSVQPIVDSHQRPGSVVPRAATDRFNTGGYARYLHDTGNVRESDNKCLAAAERNGSVRRSSIVLLAPQPSDFSHTRTHSIRPQTVADTGCSRFQTVRHSRPLSIP